MKEYSSVTIGSVEEDRDGPATITTAHKHLDFGVEKLAEMLGSLHDRLYPVLREQAAEVKAERLVPALDGSPHQVALREIAARVAALREMVGSILGRLEL